MAKRYPSATLVALAVFACLTLAHVLAILGAIAPPVGAAFAAFPFIFVCQIVAIHGLNGGWKAKRLQIGDFARQVRLMRAGLRRVPLGWRMFGLPFWYLYTPITFITRIHRAGGTVEEVDGKFLLVEHGQTIRELTEAQAFSARADMFVGASVILMGLAFAQFVLLRFILPNRQQIIDEVDQAATA